MGFLRKLWLRVKYRELDALWVDLCAHVQVCSYCGTPKTERPIVVVDFNGGGCEQCLNFLWDNKAEHPPLAYNEKM